MPTYDYSCSECGRFDAIRSISMRDEAAPCPVCGSLSARIFAFGSSLSRVDADTRRAIESNERAAHSPVLSRDYENKYSRLKHPSGCGCCSTSKNSATRTLPNGNKTFTGKRPWMISH